MHLFTAHEAEARRYFAHFNLPTHPLCWLRGHRARAEVMDGAYTEPWVLIDCRTCGIRHSDPYLTGGKTVVRDEAKGELHRQIDAARHNNADYARVRDGRDGYGHHRLDLSIEVARSTHRTPGIRLHIGDRWSETPLDGSLHSRKRAAYFSIGGVGNRLAHRVTKGQKRDIALGARFKGDGIEARS